MTKQEATNPTNRPSGPILKLPTSKAPSASARSKQLRDSRQVPKEPPADEVPVLDSEKEELIEKTSEVVEQVVASVSAPREPKKRGRKKKAASPAPVEMLDHPHQWPAEVPTSLNAYLVRVCGERKLAKQAPWTKVAVVNEALAEWLSNPPAGTPKPIYSGTAGVPNDDPNVALGVRVPYHAVKAKVDRIVFERKQAKLVPDTQGGIAREAVENWLESRGYELPSGQAEQERAAAGNS